jgi:hypothetical protein
MVPTEYHADPVVVLHDRSNATVAAVIVEVQLQIDRDKERTPVIRHRAASQARRPDQPRASPRLAIGDHRHRAPRSSERRSR